MKSLIQIACVAALLCTTFQLLDADEKSPGSPNDAVTLKGKITCAKCELNDSPTCHTVIVVRRPENANENNRDNELDTVYYFDEVSSKKYHKMVCEQGVNGTVIGVVTEKDGVKTIKVAKLAWKSQGEPKQP